MQEDLPTTLPQRNAGRLERLETRFEGHLEDYRELRALIVEMQAHLRAIENWRLEVEVYFRQIRWLIVLVIAALITGVINIVLNLELHA
jgi:membrane-bound lytic murein transglycosylase MltF